MFTLLSCIGHAHCSGHCLRHMILLCSLLAIPAKGCTALAT